MRRNWRRPTQEDSCDCHPANRGRNLVGDDALLVPPAQAVVKPGDVITKDNAYEVAELLSPGNYLLVREGMQLRIVPSDKLDWPPPFKAATEKYSPQVQLMAGRHAQRVTSPGSRFRWSIRTIRKWRPR